MPVGRERQARLAVVRYWMKWGGTGPIVAERRIVSGKRGQMSGGSTTCMETSTSGVATCTVIIMAMKTIQQEVFQENFACCAVVVGVILHGTAAPRIVTGFLLLTAIFFVDFALLAPSRRANDLVCCFGNEVLYLHVECTAGVCEVFENVQARLLRSV